MNAGAVPLIELCEASVVRDGTTVLDRINLRIQPGQHSVVLGPNGCGKSSFVKLIDRTLYPLPRNENEIQPVRLFGQSRWNVAQLRTRLGLVSADLHNDLAMLVGLDVEDAVVSGFWASHGIPDHLRVTAEMLDRAHAALDRMGILPLRHRRLATLSAGEARRALIARALVHEPAALVLDEPTTGLDILARTHFLDLLRGLANAGTTLVLVTHHLEEVLPETRQAILLQQGRVFDQGPPSSILTSEKLSSLYGLPLRVHESEDGYRHLLPGRPRIAGLRA